MNSLKKRIAIALVLVAGMLVGGIAGATPITMNFDGLTVGASVDRHYDGGCAHVLAVVPVDCHGPDYGVVWKGAKVRSFPDANEPTAPNFMGLGLLSDHATMNITDGFDTGLSFYYAALGGIQVFSGRNGRGQLLAEMQLPSPGGQCGNIPCWDFVDLTFSGTAKSVIFYGLGVFTGFDDVTLGVGAQVNPVPEPTALGMFGLGVLLIGLFAGMRRRAHQS